MTTPLATLLHGVLHDAEVRADFVASPDAFLADHGWPDLDAEDLREALLVLADGAPAVLAGALVTGAEAIDDDASLSAGAGLRDALAAIAGSESTDAEVLGADPDHDPADLDDRHDVRHQDPDDEDEDEDEDVERASDDTAGHRSTHLAERLEAIDRTAADGAAFDDARGTIHHDAADRSADLVTDVDADPGIDPGTDPETDADPFDDLAVVGRPIGDHFDVDTEPGGSTPDAGELGDGWDDLI
jgi:hypothetical protein